jgi:hypothetical protein
MVEFVFFFFTPRWQLLIFIFSRPVWIFSTIFPLFNSWYLSPFPACPIKNFLVAFSGLFLIPNGEICPFHSSNSFEVFLPLKAIFYCSCQHFKGRRSWATPNITTLYAQKNTDELKAGPDQEPLTETEYNAHKGLDDRDHPNGLHSSDEPRSGETVKSTLLCHQSLLSSTFQATNR